MLCYLTCQWRPIRLSASQVAPFALASAIALFVAAMTPYAEAANAGRTTAVVPQAQGTPPGQETRVLRPKQDVFRDERIQTDERGMTQILFVDGTSLTVGPHSDLFIDRFIYDPNTSVGEMAARMGRGVLRFVGGQVSKRGKVAISTPTAVIGVRGGMAIVEHNEESGTQVIFLFGEEATVTGLGPDGQPGETKTITRPSFSTTVSADGIVADVARVDSARLTAALRSLETQEAAASPTKEEVKKSASSYSEGSDDETLLPVDESQAIPNTAEDIVRDGEALPSPPGLWIYDLAGSTVRYALPALRSNENSRVHPLTIIKREGNALDDGGYRALYVRSTFSGTGPTQQASAIVATGYLGPNDDYPGNRFLTRVAGSARGPSVPVGGEASSPGMHILWINADEDVDRHTAPVFDGETPAERFFVAGQVRSDGTRRISIQPQDYNDPSPHVFDPVTEYRLNGPVRPLTYYGPRNDRIWNGYATGLFDGWNTNRETFLYGMSNANKSPEDIRVSNILEYSLLGARFNLSLDGDDADSGGVTEMRIDFGYSRGQLGEIERELGRTDITPSFLRGTYLSDNVFAAQSSFAWWPDGDSGSTSYQRLIWVNTGEGLELVSLSQRPYAVKRTWLFSNDAAPAEGLLPTGIRFCECPAARFGWWGGRVSFGDPEQVERRDNVFPGTFVVGSLPEIADIPTVGVASYAGHAGAAINDGAATYAAVGGFAMDWNFASRTGTATITNPDGRNYAASDLTAPVINPRDFSGTLNQVGGTDPASGRMGGSFFSDASTPVRDTGGQFNVTAASGYTATGSFAATSQ